MTVHRMYSEDLQGEPINEASNSSFDLTRSEAEYEDDGILPDGDIAGGQSPISPSAENEGHSELSDQLDEGASNFCITSCKYK